MTVFDLDKEELGDWFAFFGSRIDVSTGEIVFDKPEEGAAEFRIRSTLPFWEERRKGRKKESKFVLNPTTRGMERVVWYEDLPENQAAKENDDAWDYAITGIRNAFKDDEKTQPIECTRENKLKLIRMPVFVRFINRIFLIQNEAGVKQREASEKNS